MTPKNYHEFAGDEEKSSYTQFDSGTKLEVNKENRKVIKIGHLGAVGKWGRVTETRG